MAGKGQADKGSLNPRMGIEKTSSAWPGLATVAGVLRDVAASMLLAAITRAIAISSDVRQCMASHKTS